jgi:hypothetical protein
MKFVKKRHYKPKRNSENKQVKSKKTIKAYIKKGMFAYRDGVG